MLRRKLDFERHGSDGYTSVVRVAAIGLAVGFFVLATHLALQSWYSGRMLPGVVVAGHDVGGMSLAQARTVLQDSVHGYQLKLDVAGLRYQLTAPQLGVTFDTEATVQAAYAQGRDDWVPPWHPDPLPMVYHLDRSQLNAFASSVAGKVGTPPVDAGVVVVGTKLKTVPEKSGWSIDKVGLERLIEADVSSPGGDTLDLQPHTVVADIQADALSPTIAEAKQLMATPIILAYGTQTFTPTPTDIGQWLAFQKQPDGLAYKLVPQVDTAKLKDYVQNVANRIGVPPVNAKVTVENGVTHTEQTGADGLAVDQDPLTAAIAAAVTSQTPLTYTVTTHAVPFQTLSTSLTSLNYPKYIEVNLSKQHLWVWQDQNVIFDSPITSGATGAGFATVTGLFSIYYKTTNTHLIGYQYGYNYDVPVKYWMPFYSGYGLHDAVWRHGDFGGQDYYYGGSHGCVNLPDATAAFIYNWSDIGTPVWIHK